MAVTPNYSWPTPNDTDDANQGAAAIRSLGTAIDATVYANGTAITTLQADVTANGTAITALQSDVSTLDSTVTANGTAITGLQSDVAGKAPLLFVENVQTGNYTLALSDAAKVVAMNNSSAATVTVPPNSSVAFDVGTVVNVYAMTANTVTVAAGSGVTVRNAGALAEQYVEVSLRKRATDEWVLSGNIA